MSVSRAAAAGAALALSGLAVFGLQSPAVAAPNPANCPNNGHYPATPKAGSEHVHGEGYKHCSPADVYVESTPIYVGTLIADANGVVDGFVALPAGLPAGLHHIVIRGVAPSGAAKVTSIPVTVKAAGSPGAGAGAGSGSGVSLPRTGAEIAGMAVYSGRRRRIAAV
jgi:hypothetical protein